MIELALDVDGRWSKGCCVFAVLLVITVVAVVLVGFEVILDGDEFVPYMLFPS